MKVSTIGGALRLLWGGLCFAVGLLTVLRAPAYLLWQLAIVATEWGHLLALAALGALWPGWRRSRAGTIGGLLGLGAAVLALTPLARSLAPARELPTRLEAAFGPSSRPLGRAAPLVPGQLFSGIPLQALAPQLLSYPSPGGDTLRLDFYPAQGAAGPAPLVVVIHGGSWQGGDPSQLAPLNRYLAGQGYAVAAIAYRLAPAHPFPAARDDVLAALAFLNAQATQLAIDPERIVLLGRSAGGQLALLVAYTANDPAIRGAVSFYGPTDMVFGYQNPTNPRVLDSRAILEAYLGGTPNSAAAAYAAASPLNFVGPNTVPTLLIHGTRDELVRVRQSQRLDEALARAGRPHLLLEPPWATHGADFNLSGPFGQLSTYAVEHFLGAVTR